jgi:hypothetical protein
MIATRPDAAAMIASQLHCAKLESQIMIAPPRAERFEYRGWVAEIVVYQIGAGFGGHAALKADGRYKRTITLVKAREVEYDAKTALKMTAKTLIDEWAY